MKRYELDDKLDEEHLKATIQPVSHLLDGANPTIAPVLWRLLLAQASLMHVFIQFADSSESHINGDLMPPDIHMYKNECESPEHFNKQVDAARLYVEQRLRLLLV